MDFDESRNRESPATKRSSCAARGVLARRIAERIEASGPLTFAAFMEEALYDPDHGYYGSERSPWGREGDYLTAPQVSRALGRCVARLVLEADAALGAPDPLDVVEVGSGDGALLEAALEELRAVAPGRLPRVRAHSVERGRVSRSRQRRRLGEVADARVVAGLDGLPHGGLRGVVYSNELFDAFPVHRVRGGTEGGLEEAFVDVDGAGGLRERWGRPSSADLERHLRSAGVRLVPGQEAEVCLRLRPWMRDLGARLRRGYLLTVDYGLDRDSLYDADRRPRGTLTAMHRYRVHGDYLARPGRQDLTAHVDLDLLRSAGREVGLEPQEACSLAVFLLGFGAADGTGLHEGAGDPAEHLALRHLLLSEMAETHRALLQRKRAPALPWGRERLSSESPGPVPRSRPRSDQRP